MINIVTYTKYSMLVTFVILVGSGLAYYLHTMDARPVTNVEADIVPIAAIGGFVLVWALLTLMNVGVGIITGYCTKQK